MLMLAGLASSHVYIGCSPSTPPSGKAPKVYLDKSYYDLREEIESLHETLGLSLSDTTAKRDVLIKRAVKDFYQRYMGKYVRWSGGNIVDVITDPVWGYICRVDMDFGQVFTTADITFPVSEEFAMSSIKYRAVTVEGQIASIEGSLKVRLIDATVTPNTNSYRRAEAQSDPPPYIIYEADGSEKPYTVYEAEESKKPYTIYEAE